MRLVQPYPDHSAPIRLSVADRVETAIPVYHVRYRYIHHAGPSGYDRLGDAIGEDIVLGKAAYWLGETLLRPFFKGLDRFGCAFDYRRNDASMELTALHHYLTHKDSVYHFTYGERSYQMLSWVAPRNGNKLIATMHAPPANNTYLFRRTEYLKKLDFVVVVSTAQLSFWQDLLGADRVAYVPYAVDTHHFVPAPETRVPGRCVVVGSHERDFNSLPHIVDHVLEGSTNAHFVMVSHDERAGNATRGERAQWRRRVSDEEYRSILQSADLLVLPLVHSTTCTAVLEAMACGIPVVTNTGGISDYLDDTYSRQVPTGDTASMVQAINSILTSPERLATMKRAARTHSLNYSWGATARKMNDIYARLLLQSDAP